MKTITPEELIGKTIKHAEYAQHVTTYNNKLKTNDIRLLIYFTDNTSVCIKGDFTKPHAELAVRITNEV